MLKIRPYFMVYRYYKYCKSGRGGDVPALGSSFLITEERYSLLDLELYSPTKLSAVVIEPFDI